MLTQERLKELLDYDPETGVFTWKVKVNRKIVVGSIAGSKNPRGYIKIRIDKIAYSAHRLAWLYMYGCWPAKQIDHINRVKNDNRIENLRDVSQQNNVWNVSTPKHNKSGLMGVCYVKRDNRWLAQIKKNRKTIYIGSFVDANEAHQAYLKVKNSIHNQEV